MAQFGAPDFAGNFLSGLEAGQRSRERSQLRELTERGRQLSGEVLAGNQNKLAELYSVNPEMGMQVQQFSQAQKAQRLDELASGAMAADTPEKWQAFVQRSAAQGHRLDPGETRESILDQAMGWKEKLAQQNSDRTFNAQQKNSDRQYQLDLQQFGLAQANANWQRKMDQAKLNAQSPDLVELYDETTGQPHKARYNPKTGGFDRVGGVKAPSGTQLEIGPDGTVNFTQGMGKPLTESQSKDTVYATRMADAAPTVDAMGEVLLSFGQNVGGQMPLVGNYLKSPEYQQAEQAAGQWRQGFLRKDSGATITKEETADTNALYIPQPGDKPPVVLQKAKARRAAMKGIRAGLAPQAVMNMQKQGIDIDQVINAPLPSGGSNKGDNMGAIPQGVDPGTWQYLTPEERALWK